MSIKLNRSVNFGSRKTGLANVGYELRNSDNSVYAARIITGVYEITTGMYGAEMIFPDNWNGYIIWDTGEATPVYALEQYAYLSYQGSGGGVLVTGSNGIWTKKEKEKVIKLLEKIEKSIITNRKNVSKTADIVESKLKDVAEKIEKSRKKEESLQIIVEMNKILVEAVKDMDKKSDGFIDSIANMVETFKINNEFEQIKEELTEHVKAD